MIRLRIAEPGDIEQIVTLHVSNWQKHYRGILSDTYLDHDIYQDLNRLWQQRFSNPEPHQRILVACEENILCGFIFLYLGNHREWGTLIENLHISQSYQRRGLGKQLLVAAARLASSYSPCKGMYLEVLAGNIAAQRFYRQLGAVNSQAQQWQAPDGSLVNEFVFLWQSPPLTLQPDQLDITRHFPD